MWWNRKDKITASSAATYEFIATPIFSHYIQTFGENIATLVAIVGAAISLVAAIFISGDNYMIQQYIPFGTGFGVAGVLLFPVLGFLILVFSRFIAEQIRALAAIANNTKITKANAVASEILI